MADGSSADRWCPPDTRQRPKAPAQSQDFTRRQPRDLPLVNSPYIDRADQVTVDGGLDDSRIHYGSNAEFSHWYCGPTDGFHRGSNHNAVITPYPSTQAPFSRPLRTANSMSDRRSSLEPETTFSPPPLLTDSSTLSSASSNFLAVTPTFNQKPGRRSSQQAFPDHIDRDALARANKRMASEWSDLSESPFLAGKYDAFAPLQPKPPLVAGAGLYAGLGNNNLSLEARRASAPSLQDSSRQLVQRQPTTIIEDASAYQTYLNSELNRRRVADKTVLSIRSDRARALAHAKEQTRRTEWGKDVLLKFPMYCALAESINPDDMMATISKCGVFDLAASIL